MGYKEIHKHPNACSNGLDKNPGNINRNGRPKKIVSQLLDELSDSSSIKFEIEFKDSDGNIRIEKGEIKTKDTIKQLIAVQLLQKAVEGDLQAIRELLDRMEGKAPQRTDVNISGKELTEEERHEIIEARRKYLDKTEPPKDDR